MAMFNPETQGSLGPAATQNNLTPPAPSDTAEQRFSSLSVFAAFPFALIFGSIAISLVSTGHGPIGIIFLAFAVGVAVMALRVPYVAIAHPDGSLTFKALTRSVTTNFSHVERIVHRSGGRGGSSWVFYFDGTRAQLNNWAGRTLAGYVVDRNPQVDYPSSLDRRRY
jgi:hypothetical protein